MIIGNGLLANAFEKYSDREDVVIFASGVSNSLEQDPDSFLREKKLLKESLKTFKDSLFVYFGTCSVYDPSSIDSVYVQHKRNMEKIICEAGLSYVIFRLPQIVARSSNNATLLNFLYNNIINGRSFDLWCNAIRYIVDIDDVINFVAFVIDDGKRLDLSVNLITLPSNVLDIVECLEKILDRKAIYNLINRGVFYSIPVLERGLTVIEAGIVLEKNYLENVLVKYYK